jgi:ankyrin repeat protein
MAAERELIAAVKAGDADTVARLLGVDPDLAGAQEHGISAVRLALYHRQPAALEVLLQHSPPLDGFDHAALGWTAELRRDLARDGELASRRSADGFTALHYACFFGGAPAAGALLVAGADPDAVAENGIRPLHSAAAARETEAARVLLEAGADPNARQAGGFTALHAAAQHDDAATATLLLQHGADPALRTDAGADARGIAAANESVAVLALLG